MISNKLLAWIILSGIILEFSTEVHGAACVCDEKGTDYCAPCSGRLVVRPKKNQLPPPADINLPPIGDNCWCSKQLITPAILPKPPCPKHNTPICSCKYPLPPTPPAYADSYSAPYGAPKPAYVPPSPAYAPSYEAPPLPPLPPYAPPVPIDNSPPADPISVSLAIQAGKAIGVPEAKLSFGFVQKPIDGLKKIIFSNVPEENLYKLNNEVITLQKPLKPPPTESEELPPDEEEPELNDLDAPPVLTYKQLGYAPEKFKNPKLRPLSPYYAYDYGAPLPAYKTVPGKVYTDCGFRPGRVAYGLPLPPPPEPGYGY